MNSIRHSSAPTGNQAHHTRGTKSTISMPELILDYSIIMGCAQRRAASGSGLSAASRLLPEARRRAGTITRYTKDNLEPSPDASWFQRSLIDPHVRVQRRICVAIPRDSDADILLDWVSNNLARRGDTIDCFHFAIGEPSLAQEHTLAYIPGGFVEHDVFPPHTPDAALTHATEQWGRDLLDAHGTRLSESGVNLAVRIRPVKVNVNEASYVGHAVCRLADKMDADVLVMSTHNKQRVLSRWIPGSSTDHALRSSSRPVIVLHGSEGKQGAAAGGIDYETSSGRQLVIAIDSSDDSLFALQWMLQHMYRAADTLRLVHVIPCMDQDFYSMASNGIPGPMSGLAWEKGEQEKERWQKSRIRVFEDLIKEFGAKYSLDVLIEPAVDPVETISEALCRIVEDVEASVVLLSSHHHPSLTEFMLGSVSDIVAERSKAPVAILKGHKVESVKGSRGVVE